MIELMLFENDVRLGQYAHECGIHSFLVDLETVDEEDRQKHFDTETRIATFDDLNLMTTIHSAVTWCRINSYGHNSAEEIEKAIMAGANGIFLPMVTSTIEVEKFLRQVDDRCATGILVETLDAYNTANNLAELPFERVFFGLNDFAISRGDSSIFQAILDGSVERVRDIFSEKTFGFGGMTAIDAGFPVPAKYLLEEMARLDCDFSFLRRSLKHDMKTRDLSQIMTGINDYWEQCLTRKPDEVLDDRKRLEGWLNEICH